MALRSGSCSPPLGSVPGQRHEHSKFLPGGHLRAVTLSIATTIEANHVTTRRKSATMTKALKMPKERMTANLEKALSSRQKKVVMVVASMAEEARVYVHAKRESTVPETSAGLQ